MRPLQISLETAQKLAKALGMPIEQIMHMPQHIFRENARLWSGHFHPGWSAKIVHGTFP